MWLRGHTREGLDGVLGHVGPGVAEEGDEVGAAARAALGTEGAHRGDGGDRVGITVAPSSRATPSGPQWRATSSSRSPARIPSRMVPDDRTAASAARTSMRPTLGGPAGHIRIHGARSV